MTLNAIHTNAATVLECHEPDSAESVCARAALVLVELAPLLDDLLASGLFTPEVNRLLVHWRKSRAFRAIAAAEAEEAGRG